MTTHFREAAHRTTWPAAFPAAFTQRFSDLSESKNTKKSSDARTHLQVGQFVFVESRYFIDRHLRFLSQELDGSLVMGSFALVNVHRNAPCMIMFSTQSTRHVLAAAVR